MLESGELDRELLARAGQKAQYMMSKEQKYQKLQEKLEKSSSVTNYHSVKMDSKSFISRAKDNTTVKLPKSP